jgi:hypothetical protein
MSYQRFEFGNRCALTFRAPHGSISSGIIRQQSCKRSFSDRITGDVREVFCGNVSNFDRR